MVNIKLISYFILQTLQKVVGTLPDAPIVVGFMVDFESAMWRALREVFPDASIKGCVFHLTQAVWRKVQDLGLQTAYSEKKSTYNFVRYTN